VQLCDEMRWKEKLRGEEGKRGSETRDRRCVQVLDPTTAQHPSSRNLIFMFIEKAKWPLPLVDINSDEKGVFILFFLSLFPNLTSQLVALSWLRHPHCYQSIS